MPPGHVFVMGDNRHNARDARFMGPVPAALVRGFARGITWARGPDGIGWSRLGAIE